MPGMGVPSVIDCDIVLPPPALYTLPRGGAASAAVGVPGGQKKAAAAAEGTGQGGRARKDSKKAAKLSTLKKRKGSKSQTESVV